MDRSISNVLDMKKRKTKTGYTVYDWFFMELERNYLDRPDGTKRNALVAKFYTKEAQAYLVHQLYYLNDLAATELMIELKLLDMPLISDENYRHIKKKTI